MEQTRFVNLPIIGRIQHGERTNNRVVELGHFIAKIDDNYMKAYSQKFNEQYKGKQSIEIEFFNEEPLTIKYARYNQSGEVCSCMADSNEANQKTKNGWQKINCDTFKCQYRQRNEQGKCACNRIGWLKFIIPSVCKDRIFLMRITGQTSINRLDDYFSLQRAQGNSIKGRYTLFLKQEEQSNSLGKTFNNYVLDILKKEDFISQNTTPENTEKPKELSTENRQNVNNKVVNSNTTQPKVEATKKVVTPSKAIETPKEETTKKATTKITKSKSKKTEEIKKETDSKEKQEKNKLIDNLNNTKKVAQKLYISYIEEKMKLAKEYLKDVNIKFYSVLKTTGEIKEDFVITYKNTPLSDLSRSETIATALEFANMFNQISRANFPIFIDDYESCADYDFIKEYSNDTQIIISKVEKGNPLTISDYNTGKATVIKPFISGFRTFKTQKEIKNQTAKLPQAA